MVFKLAIAFFLLNYSSTTIASIFYANVTDKVCISIFSDTLRNPAVLAISKDTNETVFLLLISTSSNASVIVNPGNVEEVNVSNQTLSFCRLNSTLGYAGNYSIYGENNTSTLFVLDKPEQAEIILQENGVVGIQNASLRCTAKSTSKPYGLEFSFVWMINSVELRGDSKYVFSDNNKSVLFINTERNESKNNYTCRGVEQFGQKSEESLSMSLNPYRTPLLEVLPKGKVFNVIKNRTASLNCSVIDSHPVPFNYSWYKNNKIVKENSSTLTLENVDAKNSGNYKCKAYNIAGENDSAETILNVLYGPFITDISTKSQEEGYDITVECIIFSNPLVSVDDILWSRSNDKFFTQRGKFLNLTNVTKTDEGIYTCNTSVLLTPSIGQQYKNESSTSFELKVLYGPTVSLRRSYTQIEHRGINISCNISSNPMVSANDVIWTRNGEVHSTGFNLIIHAAKRNESGIYNCSTEVTLTISDGMPRKRLSSATMKMNILYGPEVSLRDEVKQIEDRPINITCNVISNPPPNPNEFLWTKNNVKAQDGTNLMITKVGKQHAGLYNCTVKLTLIPTDGESEQRSASDDIKLNVLFGPEVNSYIASAEEGESLTIICNISSNPTARDENVTWTKVGNSTFNDDGLTFFFDSVDRKDLGQFTCNVSIRLTPTFGFHEERSKVGNVDVIVFYQPNVLEVTTEEVYEGNRTQVICKVDGNPTPSIKWTYVDNDTNITGPETTTNNTISTSSILFTSARCEDTGTYRCHANNSIKTASMNATTLIVKCPPRLSYLDRLPITIGRNESLNITVFFHAVPQPIITWRFNGSDLPNFTVASVKNKLPYIFASNLLKNDFGKSNIGQYSINATNELGSALEFMEITFQREPYTLDILDLNCKEVPGSAKIVWKSQGNGGLPQHFIILYRQLDHSELSESDKINESIREYEYTKIIYNLHNNEEYIFMIKAENSIGHMLSRQRNCTTLGADEQSSTLRIVGGVLGSVTGITVIGVILIIHKKRKANKPRQDKELIQRATIDYPEDDDGLKDNPLYVQSSQVDEYTIIEKTKAKSVDKKGRKLKHGKGHKAERDKQLEMADVYENAGEIVKFPEGPLYGNVDENISQVKTATYKNKKNKDGLIYADLEFSPCSSKFVIRGIENKSVYADIDLTKKVDPLPLDSDDDEQGSSDRQTGDKRDQH